MHYTSFAACTCVYVVIALLALKIQSWSSLHTMRRRNYLETSIAIIKMPGYCSESHSQLHQSSTNVRLHSCSFIIQFLSLLAVRLIIMITLCIAPQRDFLWPESRPCVAHIFHTGIYVFVTFVYIICIAIIFVLNDYIHTFSIHCTWSFSIIKLFIIGQVLSYTNNCKKMEQSNYFFYFFQWWNWQRSEMFRAAVAKGF